jgi:hypothetical protein
MGSAVVTRMLTRMLITLCRVTRRIITSAALACAPGAC